ncbi:hypothetical protein MKK63_12400 [Methylobacterium sp. J-088]|uniref:hypothetical protein n=1 Tax=Methylobacterium sp. J-088 TaxID=2836664 RepID=UPI001FB8917E|nr:hypothetical protein [Methylobacterium sp. J-088]MCJ2063507.1 hypothetical protein [Methylobacterium sp. J-088]
MSGEDEATLTIHGLQAHNEAVDGEVFAEKLKAFLTALAIADVSANGARRHRYMISALAKNTATASFREHLVSNGPPPLSSVDYYRDGLGKIQRGDPSAKDLPKNFVKQVALLNRGVGKNFDFGEIKFSKSDIVRIDDLMRHQAVTLLNQIERAEKSTRSYYKGQAFVNFDGVLKAVDLRGEIKTAYLILTAGGRQIDCVITNLDSEQLRDALDKRAIIGGLALYRGDSGLPSRIDVRAARVITEKRNLSRWRGAFAIEARDDELEWSRD